MTQKKCKINPVEFIKKNALITIARTYKYKKQPKTAELFYSKVLDHSKVKLPTAYYYEYASVLHKNNNAKKALEQIDYALNDDKNKNHAKHLVLRSEIYIKLRQYANAERDIGHAIELVHDNAFAHYISGIILILQKKWHQAEESLSIAQQLGYSSAKFYRRLGQASFEMGHYSRAAEAYYEAVQLWGNNKRGMTKADLYYMVGLSYEKLGNIDLSNSYYKQAIKNDEKYDSENLGIGIFHNIYQEYDLAIKAFSKMNTAEPYYRAALLHDRMGNKEQAINDYKKALSLNQIRSKYHFRLAVCYEDIKNYEKAETYYKQAIARHNNHNLQWHLKLLNVLDKLGKKDEYKKVLHDANIISDYVNSVYQNGNNRMSRQERYNMFYNKLEIQEKTVLFESMSGNRFSGNPLAVFKQMLKDNRFKDYTFIWAVNNENVVPDEYKKLPNVIVALRYNDLFYKYLSTASILVNNVTFPPFFKLKENQKYLNTWHGTPWKTLGYDVKMAKMDYANVARNFLQATHLSLPNKYTYDHQTKPYQIDTLLHGEASIIGYPRIDLTYQGMENKSSIKNQLNITDNRKIILYAPTWRGESAFRSFDQAQLEYDLEKLSHKDAHILFRGHHLAENLLTDINIPNVTIVPEYFDTNELLGIVDIMITDYSSVFFDFLVTDKPIIHYVYDYDSYEAERGLYFGLNELPGDVARNTEELINSVENYLSIDYKPTNKYLAAKDKFVYKDDGKVTERVIDWVVFGDKDIDLIPQSNTNKKKILFHVGIFQPNGITAAFINLVKAIDKDKYDITVVVADSIINYPERLELLDKVQKDVNIIPRTGAMNRNDGGRFAETLNNINVSSDRINDILTDKYQEEFKRIFNKTEFDYIVDFNGYSAFYNRLLVNNPNSNSKNVVYVHSDIYSEYQNRYPALKQIFNQYKKYDKVISVSKPTSELNITNLSDVFQIPESKFDYIENVQDPETVISLSKLALDDVSETSLFSKDIKTFITIGRLSEEKDHEKLIRAFSKVNQANSNTKLVIIGDGPLNHRLESIVKELKLSNSVHLLGRKSNPYSYLKQSDCFVLSSNYEGQPIVLFEALILDKPVIATDIVANRDILKDGYGELCENSIDGLTQAMNDFIDGKLHSKDFDIDAYNDQALKMFYDKVL